MMFRVIIKGQPFEAREAAKSRGFDFGFLNYNAEFKQTVGHVSGIEDNVSKWFVEDNHVQEKPIGSLLYYRSERRGVIIPV